MTDLLDPALEGLDLTVFMREALFEADCAGAAGELPIGAVLVIGGEIVSRGHARQNAKQSQIAHAEMDALLNGGLPLWERYREGILFTSVEPCPMCLGATVMADVPHIIFASHDEVVHSRAILQNSPYVKRHIKSYYGGVLETESREIIGRYNPRMLAYVSTGRSDTNG